MSGDTPFARGPSADLVGDDGEVDAVEEMLKGKFTLDIKELDEAAASSEMKSFIMALKIPTSKKTGSEVPEMSVNMKMEGYIRAFRKTAEATASSPSGIHYGHYIAACESKVLAEVNLLFMETPFQVGIPLTRWTRSLHCMIQKMEQPFVNKLRIVQLYEADFNTMLKFIIGRRLMQYGEKHGLNGHQLYGSCKGRSTYDALITVRIIYDMARTQQDYIISIFNDLKGCYDRVRPAVNTITTRRMGLPKSVALCHASALKKLRHHIRTGFGIST